MPPKPEYKDRMADYVDVAERIREFKAKYPDGTLQAADPLEPFKLKDIGGKTFVVYTAAAYRAPDDARPGIGVAWEPFPGTTPYTRDSELMNAETSAWGRAIVAVGIPTKKIASAEEVRNRAELTDAPPARKAATPSPATAKRDTAAEKHVNAPTFTVPPDEEIEDLLLLAESRGFTARQVRFWLKSRDRKSVAKYLADLPDKAGEG